MDTQWLKNIFWGYFHSLTSGVVIFVASAWVLHKAVPDIIPQAFRLDFYQSLVISLFIVVFDRLWTIEGTIRTRLLTESLFRYYPTREIAYEQVCEFLRNRSGTVRQIDLLQFSGATAVNILREAARSCPRASIRLLLANADYADRFDEPDFHRTRIRHTLSVIRLMKEFEPSLHIGVWSYQTEPGIAGSSLTMHSFPSVGITSSPNRPRQQAFRYAATSTPR